MDISNVYCMNNNININQHEKKIKNIKQVENKEDQFVYDGRYNGYFYNTQNIELYKKVESLKEERKIESIMKSNKYNSNQEEEKYKRVDTFA
jgi:hypothetical protein